MIRVDRISRRFDGRAQVTAAATSSRSARTSLDNVNLTSAKGQLASITGPSGSGKSTLPNLVGGLDRATEGDVYLDRKALARLSNDGLTRSERLGHLPEELSGLKLIRDLHSQLGSTIVIVTHDMGVAERCERTIALRDGPVVEDVAR